MWPNLKSLCRMDTDRLVVNDVFGSCFKLNEAFDFDINIPGSASLQLESIGGFTGTTIFL